jgi:hypothetical protein
MQGRFMRRLANCFGEAPSRLPVDVVAGQDAVSFIGRLLYSRLGRAWTDFAHTCTPQCADWCAAKNSTASYIYQLLQRRR